ncbi:hypothetical protein IF2G_05243 [Cordyceps javanica]|nr:hypothetical protein IF2G_05243 [Cordyceps javanica]
MMGMPEAVAARDSPLWQRQRLEPCTIHPAADSATIVIGCPGLRRTGVALPLPRPLQPSPSLPTAQGFIRRPQPHCIDPRGDVNLRPYPRKCVECRQTHNRQTARQKASPSPVTSPTAPHSIPAWQVLSTLLPMMSPCVVHLDRPAVHVCGILFP